MKTLLLAGAALMIAPIAQAGEINISFSEDFTETLNEDYGVREGEVLIEELTEDLTRTFGDELASMGDINITIIDAKPNRPTFEQMGAGLSFESISIGGADLVGEVVDADGAVIASVEYDYYSHSIEDSIGRTTWSDARRAFDRFTRRLASEYEVSQSDSVS